MKNKSFDEFWYHPVEDTIVDGTHYMIPPEPGDTRPTVAEFQVPNFWRFHWTDSSVEGDYWDGQPWNLFRPPEMVHRDKTHLPEHEWYPPDGFIRDGRFTLKLFKGTGAWQAGLYQVVDLAPGKYTLTVPAFPDVYAWTGEKDWAPDPVSANIRFTVGVHTTPWQHLQAGVWHEPTHSFEHPGGEVSIGFTLMCPFAVSNSGFFIDDLSLVRTDVPPPPPPEGDIPEVVKTGSHFSIHTILPNNTVDLSAIASNQDTPFHVVKAVDAVSTLKDVAVASPDSVLMARFTDPGIESATRCHNPMNEQDYKDFAAQSMRKIKDATIADSGLKATVHYWELWNEPGGGGVVPEFYARLAKSAIEAINIAEEMGIKLAMFGFSAGTPEWADMVVMAGTDLFDRMAAGGHILTLHEGVFDGSPISLWWNEHNVDASGNPTTQDTGQVREGGWIPGAPVVMEAGAMCGRYKFWEQILEDNMPLVFISEFYPGSTDLDSDEQYVVTNSQWYDWLISKDSYILGYAPFTLGPTAAWVHTDYERIYPEMLDYATVVKDRVNGIYDEPEPEPDTDGTPPFQFEKVYHYIDPKHVTKTEAKRLSNAIINSGNWASIGPSLDEALMYSGLTDITGVCYNIPDSEKASIMQYRDKYYKKAKLLWKRITVTPPPPPAHTKFAIGLHDHAGAEYTKNAWGNVDKTTTVIPLLVEGTPIDIDLTHLHPAGKEAIVCVRLNYSWAKPEGKGTMPPPSLLGAHLDALVATMKSARGVTFFQLWNEPNNLREMPPDLTLTPDYVVTAYNYVWDRTPFSVFVAPPAIDPYYGPGSNNKDWNEYILNNINGADWLATHAGKSQTNNPDDIYSTAKFSDWPLEWQYLHSRTLETWMAQVPEKFRSLPVMAGELNPSYKDFPGGTPGWIPGNAAWVHKIMQYITDWNEAPGHQLVKAAVLYRYDRADPWGVSGDDAILTALHEEAVKNNG